MNNKLFDNRNNSTAVPFLIECYANFVEYVKQSFYCASIGEFKRTELAHYYYYAHTI